MTRPEKLEDIATLARACREAQEHLVYFTRREDRELLLAAKQQERRLDEVLGMAGLTV